VATADAAPFASLPAPGERGRRLISPATAVAVAYVAAIFMSAMDTHIVNVALPTLARSFGAPLADVQWTVIGYVLALALVIPASGWISDRFGMKRTFQIALALFTVASALCGIAHSLGELVAARALQGIGGGMLTPVGTAMLFRAYPPARRARMVRLLLVPILLGPATAPILGGWLTTDASWRWVFLVNVPVGFATLIFSGLYLTEHREPSPGRLDVLGLILSSAGLSMLMYAISEGGAKGWGSLPIVVSGTAGVLSFVAFARTQSRRSEPLLRLSLLRDRLFRASNIVIAFGSGAFIGSLYLTPIFLQVVHHVSPLNSGLTTFVEAIGVAFASQTLGRLYPRLGPRVMATAGGITLTGALLCFVLIDATTNLWVVRILMFFVGAFNSGTFLGVQSAMFTTISSADTGHASAIYNTQRQAAIATSVAILTTIVAGVHGSRLTAFHAAYIATAAMAAFAAIAALTLIRTSDARGTMVRPARRAAATGASRSEE
jgi:EmrB/QacA subfamily drug resistance transporter